MIAFLRTHFFIRSNLIDFFTTALPLICSQVANCFPWIIGFALIGSTGDVIAVSALNLNLTYYSLFAYAMAIAIIEVAGTICSTAFGTKDYRTMGICFYQTSILLFVVGVNYALTTLYSYELLVFINIEDQVASRAAAMIRASWPVFFVQNFNLMLQTYLMSQNVI